ncbi:serpin B [Eubacterium ruminantium]|nr:serpin B [Eubacterium ruminantium]
MINSIINTSKISVYSTKYNSITCEITNELANLSLGENIIFSPLSIITLLGLATEATDGKTRREVVDYLSGMNCSDIHKTISSSDALASANAAIVRADYASTIKESFKKIIGKSFDAECISAEDIIGTVNAWVNEKTDGMIPSIADESMRNLVASLINAVCFKAKWAKPYEDYQIKDYTFTDINGNEKEVPMMYSSERGYIENEALTGFTKSYRGNEFDFMALLPKEKGLKALNDCLYNLNFSELYKNLNYIKVYTKIPEFKSDSLVDLNPLLTGKGIKNIFASNADFSPMTDKPIMLDKIIHKAHIEVDRNGTKAAAVTMAYAVAGCAPGFMEETKEVNLDRPFIYSIIHKETGLPVFVGITDKI